MMILGTTMHFSKAAMLSASTMIEQESIGGFFIPIIPIIVIGGLAVARRLIPEKVFSSASKQRVGLVVSGTVLLVIGITTGVSAMTTTLGEHIDFDYTLYDLVGNEEGVKAQLLHTIGLEKITVGTLISSAFYATMVFYSLYNIYKSSRSAGTN